MKPAQLPLPTWPTFALLVAGLALAAGCGRGGAEAQSKGSLPTTPVLIMAARVQRITLQPSVDLVGTLVAIPEQTASVSSQTERWIEKVPIVEGSEVRAGDMLVQLDTRMAKVDRDRAKATVNQRTAAADLLRRGSLPKEIEMAQLEAAKAMYSARALRSQLAALKVLLDKEEISPVQYENVHASLQEAEATQAATEAKLKLIRDGSRPEQIAEAQAQLEAAQADLAAADLAITLGRITSPIDGTVTSLSARVGALATPATPLATIANLSSLFAKIQVPSAYQARFQVGARADVLVSGGSSKSIPGKIARISSEADSATGDVNAYVLVENQQRILRPGFACTVRIWLPSVENALVIPTAAVADRDGTPVVTVVRDGKAYETEVNLGVHTRSQVEVLQGLSDGDVVATQGGYGLPDGCPVVIQQ